MFPTKFSSNSYCNTHQVPPKLLIITLQESKNPQHQICPVLYWFATKEENKVYCTVLNRPVQGVPLPPSLFYPLSLSKRNRSKDPITQHRRRGPQKPSLSLPLHLHLPLSFSLSPPSLPLVSMLVHARMAWHGTILPAK